MEKIDQLFGHLDQWRHLPAYALERRADIFFSLYVRDVVARFTGEPISARFLPEFPIQRDLVTKKAKKRAQAMKVDYVLCNDDKSRVFFVDIATDTKSRNKKHAKQLERAAAAGFRRVVEGVVEIAKKTEERKKYFRLLSELAALGFVSVPDRRALRPAQWKRRVAEIEIEALDPEIRVLFVGPKARGKNAIGFEEFADEVGRHEDPLSVRFRESLVTWRGGAAV